MKGAIHFCRRNKKSNLFRDLARSGKRLFFLWNAPIAWMEPCVFVGIPPAKVGFPYRLSDVSSGNAEPGAAPAQTNVWS